MEGTKGNDKLTTNSLNIPKMVPQVKGTCIVISLFQISTYLVQHILLYIPYPIHELLKLNSYIQNHLNLSQTSLKNGGCIIQHKQLIKNRNQ